MALARAGTETEAANAALRLMGVAPIADINAGKSTAARECRAAFGDARDETLRKREWNFATAWSTLTKLATPAANPAFPKAYELPADCLRVRRVDKLSNDQWDFESLKVGGDDKFVLVTASDSATICYTRRVEKVNLWDAEFLAAFAMVLAGKVAPALSREFTAGAQLDALADSKIADAAATGAKERPPTEVSRETSWITARRL